jgi:nucleotide-binding universal stress UspA family protein
MKKILIAVDDTKGTKNAFELCGEVCSCMRPETIVLTYVEQFSGRSFLDEMITDAELTTLKEWFEGSDYKEAMDSKAIKILDHYKKALADKGVTNVKTVIKSGHPAEEILNAAKEEDVNMIIVGSRGKRASSLLMGSVSREVVNRSEIPVLIVK